MIDIKHRYIFLNLYLLFLQAKIITFENQRIKGKFKIIKYGVLDMKEYGSDT